MVLQSCVASFGGGQCCNRLIYHADSPNADSRLRPVSRKKKRSAAQRNIEKRAPGAASPTPSPALGDEKSPVAMEGEADTTARPVRRANTK